MNRKKRILVSPLNWGLGHATRCIPIINELISQGAEVILAAEGRPAALLRQEFPELEIIGLPGYNISYPEDDRMTRHMLKSLPVIFGGIIKEHQALNKIIDDLGIDGIISDNRYGLYTRKVKTVVITHQLAIQAPSFKKIVNVLSHWFIKRFNECWIPDYPNSLLGMELSSATMDLINHSYIGPLSRFSPSDEYDLQYDILAVVSGPEPQRTLFQDKIIRELNELNLRSLVVLGKTEEEKSWTENNITFHNHLPAKEMEKAFQQSRLIVARSGYSTLMDIERLKKNAILIPTPGQPEQEYLAQQLMDRDMFFTMHQDFLHLKKGMEQANSGRFSGYITKETPPQNLLASAITGFLESIDA